MKFEKRKSTLLVAKGSDGVFVLTKRNGRWWAQYNGNSKSFNLPPVKSLKVAKEMCMDNYFWEE